MSKLVIVESPAKAKTISRFLGNNYTVEASYGHVRDLPESAADIPKDLKGKKWATLGVNVEDKFQPIYVVPDDKVGQVSKLKKLAASADEILLATDEDREGESISWHIQQLINPKSKIRVSRIVFHEITPEAIEHALQNPRSLDEALVRAQETRRILDRLYGYTLSPLLWKKVAPKLSAGRVQSVAVRLCVVRERERMAFHGAEYWDLSANLGTKDGAFEAKLASYGGQNICSGTSFDPATGRLKDKSLQLNRDDAESLARVALDSKPWTVVKQDSKPGKEMPPKPFMTSTLQQEAARKLRFPSRKTMQVAQTLYEGVDLGGERIGLITYMRTDSLTLADRALNECRDVIAQLYGKEYLPKSAVRYRTSSKGAQEAHEAIRPTDLSRQPKDLEKYLTKDQFALYELIWKRTIACQMVPAEVLRSTIEVEVDLEGKKASFTASGKTIEFPGFLRAYVEGSDDPEADLDQRERVLPPVKVGEVVTAKSVDAERHETHPPARYTEASLIKKLEEEGIGRPSTYVSIISTIQDRGYIFKKGNELVPSFTAFAVITLLEQNFGELVDLAFTARMEQQLDEIADGTREMVGYLSAFYRGDDDRDGLEKEVNAKAKDIPYPTLELGENEANEPVVVKIGRFGPYIQIGEGGKGKVGSIPDTLAPAELSLETALALVLGRKEGGEAYTTDPETGREIFHKKGRFGEYFELAQTEEESKKKEKPRRASVPAGESLESLSAEDVLMLLSFPRTLGADPQGNPVQAMIGRYGPFVICNNEIRNVENWRAAASIKLEEALALLSQPKPVRGAASQKPSTEPIQDFGEEDGVRIRVLDGRFGPYVTDGKTNATIPKSTNPSTITRAEASELLRAREARGPVKSKFKRTKQRKRT